MTGLRDMPERGKISFRGKALEWRETERDEREMSE